MPAAQAPDGCAPGAHFGVFRSAADAPGLSPVCRFYGTAGIGPNSHFYTSEPGECALVKTDRGWTYEGIAFYITRVEAGNCPARHRAGVPQLQQRLPAQRLQPPLHRRRLAVREVRLMGLRGRGRGDVRAALGAADLAADAVRLLRQASFGPTPAEVARVPPSGPAAWVDEQLAPACQRAIPNIPTCRRRVPRPASTTARRRCAADSFCARDNYTLYPLQLQFFRNALAAPDQLRQRVAFALSQIMVTSGVDNSRNYAMRRYQQMLSDHAFGNFYDLLLAVTLSPMMGDYLDMVNNNKEQRRRAAPSRTRTTRARCCSSSPSAPTCSSPTARAASTPRAGRSSPTTRRRSRASRTSSPGGPIPPSPAPPRATTTRATTWAEMRAVDANHDFGAKDAALRRGRPGRPASRCTQDLEFAHRNIFEHPNVGPFIGRQLIQQAGDERPVARPTWRASPRCSPTTAPAMRGDLRAVVRAILLDPEARGARKVRPRVRQARRAGALPHRHRRAPSARAATASTSALQSATLGPVRSSTRPRSSTTTRRTTVVPGTGLPGPEFGLPDLDHGDRRANLANALLFSAAIAPDPTLFGAIGTAPRPLALPGARGRRERAGRRARPRPARAAPCPRRCARRSSPRSGACPPATRSPRARARSTSS